MEGENDVAMQFPLLLKKGQRIKIEERVYTVHMIDFFEKDRFGPLHNRVGIETTVGTYITVPLASQVEI